MWPPEFAFSGGVVQQLHTGCVPRWGAGERGRYAHPLQVKSGVICPTGDTTIHLLCPLLPPESSSQCRENTSAPTNEKIKSAIADFAPNQLGNLAWLEVLFFFRGVTNMGMKYSTYL